MVRRGIYLNVPFFKKTNHIHFPIMFIRQPKLVFALFFQSEKQNESEEEPETVWLFAFQEVLEACFQKRMGCKNGFMKSYCGVEKSQFL